MVIKTKSHQEVIDITSKVEEVIEDKGFRNGLCHLFLKHTTCAITTADLDPGTDLDILEALEKLLPDINWRHPHDPSHTPNHILSSIIGASLAIPVKDGKLVLGTWQRVVLIELEGPREREIEVSLVESVI